MQNFLLFKESWRVLRVWRHGHDDAIPERCASSSKESWWNGGNYWVYQHCMFFISFNVLRCSNGWSYWTPPPTLPYYPLPTPSLLHLDLPLPTYIPSPRSYLSPLDPHFHSPLTSHLSPLPSPLSPLPSPLSPLPSPLSPLPSPLSPLPSRLSPLASRLSLPLPASSSFFYFIPSSLFYFIPSSLFPFPFPLPLPSFPVIPWLSLCPPPPPSSSYHLSLFRKKL